jgi:DNA-directed RNA polymerase subunit E'/Rpb7
MPIIKKQLETTVDLFKPADIYAADVKSMLIGKLTERYVGKCYQSMLITAISNIVRYSDTHLVDNRLDGAAYIDVQFEATGLVLIKGEILHGCKVVEITASGIIVDHKQAGGLVQADPKKQVIKVIKPGQLIPVVIQAVRYNPNQSQITIRGIPYTPSFTPNVFYNITEILSPEDTEKASSLLDELAEEIKLHNAVMSSKNYEFFKELTYPFKTTQKFESSKLGERFTKMSSELKHILEIRDGCLISPIESSKLPGLTLFHSKKEETSDVGMVVDSQLYPAILDMISKRLMYLRNLRGFAEQYDTPEKIQDMMIYWKICQNLKE